MSSIIFTTSDILGTIFVIFKKLNDDELTIEDGLISIGPTIELNDIAHEAKELKRTATEQYIINVAEIRSQGFIDSLLNTEGVELVYSFIPPDDIMLSQVITDNEIKFLSEIDDLATTYMIQLPLFIK